MVVLSALQGMPMHILYYIKPYMHNTVLPNFSGNLADINLSYAECVAAALSPK